MSQKSYKELLYAPFDLHEHEVRELRTTGSGKVQWLAYIRREAIQNRLDDLFFGEWSTEIVEVHRGERAINVRMKMTVRGVTRENNGSQGLYFDRTEKHWVADEHAEKGAVTDAFKRTASMFGIGLYLQSSPDIYTDGYKDGGQTDWNKKRKMEADAMAQLGRWLNGLHSIDSKMDQVVQHEPQSMIADSVETVVENGTPYILAGALAYALTRQPFNDAGYDTRAWVQPGVYALEPHALITYQTPDPGTRGEILTVQKNKG